MSNKENYWLKKKVIVKLATAMEQLLLAHSPGAFLVDDERCHAVSNVSQKLFKV
mgnify:CR=1 FL=1